METLTKLYKKQTSASFQNSTLSRKSNSQTSGIRREMALMNFSLLPLLNLVHGGENFVLITALKST